MFRLAVVVLLSGSSMLAAPLRVAIIGLNHGHVNGFLNGGALVPASDASAKRLHLSSGL
jgi:hypothetical protein